MLNSWVKLLTWLKLLSQPWRAFILFKLHWGHDGIRETCYMLYFFVWKERVVMGDEREGERETFCMRSYFRVGMGPWAAQQAKESWKAIKKKLLSTVFHSVNHRCLRDWKQLYSSTWVMHLSSAISKSATGLNQWPSVCFFQGVVLSIVAYTCSTLPYGHTHAFIKILWCIVWWKEFRSRI